MNRRRERADGLPYRVYERRGVRLYSIGYKRPDGTWAFRLTCPATSVAKIAELRREAIKRAADIEMGAPVEGTFAALADAWLARQRALPANAQDKRADSTLEENVRELAMLKRAFGAMHVGQMEKSDAYAYLDACSLARDKKGNPRPRAAKGNKEIALARRVLEFGVRVRLIAVNPFDGVEKLATIRRDRLVSDAELALALEVGRRMGGPQHIVGLALRTAWLCLRRSVEIRALTRAQITEDGILWEAAKRQRGEAVKRGLIEWSPALRSTVDEALSVKRNKLAGSWYVFGNLNGQRYTKGGWKATLSKLMAECALEAKQRSIPFEPFSLQDCRPKGVTDKLASGATDTLDATMHSSDRMVRQVYDRRRIRIAKPTR